MSCESSTEPKMTLHAIVQKLTNNILGRKLVASVRNPWLHTDKSATVFRSQNTNSILKDDKKHLASTQYILKNIALSTNCQENVAYFTYI